MEKRGRELSAAEAQNVLESTATRKTLVSWFKPFFSQMVTAVERRKSTVILGGMDFNIRRYGDDYVFMRVGNFTPMTRISLADLISNASVDYGIRS